MNPRGRVLLGSLLESRTMCAAVCGAGALHVGLIKAGVVGWPCPVRHAFGIPCPGCGLGRAVGLLFSGHPAEAVRVHAFAPLAAAVITLLFVGSIAPDAARRRLSRMVVACETAWPVTPLVSGALVIYWLLRFVLDAPNFYQLVN